MELADRVHPLAESSTLALNARVKQLAATGTTVYNLTAGELDCDTPPDIQAAVATTLAQNKYTPVPGLPELRQAIAEHARLFYAPATFTPDQIVVTAGAKPALAATFLALLNPGDEVIVPTPAWVSYRHLIELAGGRVVEVPLGAHWGLDVPAIAAAATSRTKAIIINSPHNPTGAVFSAESLQALAKQVADRPIAVISDDIYAKLVYTTGFHPLTRYGFSPDRLVIINGFSKSQALTGWRIGYLVAPVTIAAAVTKLLSHITGNAAIPSQQAALAALRTGDVPTMLPILRHRRQLVATSLRRIPGLDFELPAGGFYFFLDLRSLTTNASTWCEQLLARHHVALVPGEAFAAPGFARLSFAADDATLTAAIDHINALINEAN